MWYAQIDIPPCSHRKSMTSYPNSAIFWTWRLLWAALPCHRHRRNPEPDSWWHDEWYCQPMMQRLWNAWEIVLHIIEIDHCFLSWRPFRRKTIQINLFGDCFLCQQEEASEEASIYFTFITHPYDICTNRLTHKQPYKINGILPEDQIPSFCHPLTTGHCEKREIQHHAHHRTWCFLLPLNAADIYSARTKTCICIHHQRDPKSGETTDVVVICTDCWSMKKLDILTRWKAGTSVPKWFGVDCSGLFQKCRFLNSDVAVTVPSSESSSSNIWRYGHPTLEEIKSASYSRIHLQKID